jgi:small subunit ribosomal protein S4
VVRHNGVLVNGKRVNIPSYTVRPGDEIQLTDGARNQLRVKASLEAADSRGFPEWLAMDVKAGKGTFKAMPQRSELSPTLNEGLVIELYSK